MHATVSKISFRLQLFIFIKNVLCVNECQGFEKFLISNYRSKYDIDQGEERLFDKIWINKDYFYNFEIRMNFYHHYFPLKI